MISKDSTFNANEYIRQYSVLNYYIDLACYSKDENHIMLFEYDELYHNAPNQKIKDTERMVKIKAELINQGYERIQLFRIKEGEEWEFYYWYLLFYIDGNEIGCRHLKNFLTILK